MGTKITLRTLGVIDLGAPTIDQARSSLGGRAGTEREAGERVRVSDARGERIEGVVVFASAMERDVWIGEGRFLRVASSECEPIAEGAPVPAAVSARAGSSLPELQADARRFAAVIEGSSVRFLDRQGRAATGVLAEKCRYGGLVVVSGAKVLAVSFRRIWPVDVAS